MKKVADPPTNPSFVYMRRTKKNSERVLMKSRSRQISWHSNLGIRGSVRLRLTASDPNPLKDRVELGSFSGPSSGATLRKAKLGEHDGLETVRLNGLWVFGADVA